MSARTAKKMDPPPIRRLREDEGATTQWQWIYSNGQLVPAHQLFGIYGDIVFNTLVQGLLPGDVLAIEANRAAYEWVQRKHVWQALVKRDFPLQYAYAFSEASEFGMAHVVRVNILAASRRPFDFQGTEHHILWKRFYEYLERLRNAPDTALDTRYYPINLDQLPRPLTFYHPTMPLAHLTGAILIIKGSDGNCIIVKYQKWGDSITWNASPNCETVGSVIENPMTEAWIDPSGSLRLEFEMFTSSLQVGRLPRNLTTVRSQIM